MTTATWVEYFDRTLYQNFPEGWDDYLYVEQIEARANSNDRILDLGAGRGANPRIVLSQDFPNVHGVDVTEEVLENPHLCEAKIMDGNNIPYPDQHFDVVISSYVLEHLEDPVSIFQEVGRVLKPGGYFISRTPNKYHYVALIASITPHWFHELINRKRGRLEKDTFPTFYRANSLASLKSIAQDSSFDVDAIGFYDGRPEYLRFNAATYLAGYLYERLISRIQWLQCLRPLMVCSFRKPLVPVSKGNI